MQQAQTINPDVNETSVALMAPYFSIDPTDLDGTNGLAWEGTSPFNCVPSLTHLLTVDLGFTIRAWSAGNNNILPVGQNVSSFDVLDQIVEYYNDETLFPVMQQVVIAGHSQGAQFVHRYAAVGKVMDLRGKQLE